MKIMHFIHGLNTGGAETLVKDYMSNFDNKKNDIVLLCLFHKYESPYEKLLIEDGVRMIFVEDFLLFHGTTFFNRFFNHLYRYLLVRRIVRREAPDILHTHLPLYTFVKFAKPNDNTVIIDTIHTEPKKVLLTGNKMRKTELNAAKWLIRKYKMKFIILHDGMKKEIDEMFGVSDSIILNNGVDVSKYKKMKDKNIARSNLGVPKNAFVVGHVGRFSEVKNHCFLIDVFRNIKGVNKNAFLLMIGDGEEKEKIKKKLDDYGFNGNYLILSNRDDIPDILAAMDVFVFPSKHEGLPVSLVEAQEAKLPCFVSDVVSEHAVISNLVTMLPLDDGTEKWANTIMKYKKPKKVIIDDKDWDIKKITKQLENIYEKALKERDNGKK